MVGASSIALKRALEELAQQVSGHLKHCPLAINEHDGSSKWQLSCTEQPYLRRRDRISWNSGSAIMSDAK